MQYLTNRRLTVLMLVVALALGSPAVVCQDLEAYKPVRIEAPPPEYPRRAYQDEVEGWVDLELTIDAKGRVDDVAVLDAEPRGLFERSAIRAVMRWRYRPPGDDGMSAPVKDRVRLAFKIELY